MDFIELQFLLLGKEPSKELQIRKDELAKLIPEIEKTYDFQQATIWHPYDVFFHTMKVVDSVDCDIRLRLAALFHDIGKPNTMTFDEDGHGHFYGHWEESEKIFTKYQNQMFLKEEDIYFIRKLIFYHDLEISPSSLSIFLEQFSEEDMKLLFSLKRADILSQNPDFVEERLRKLKQTEDYYFSISKKINVKNINDQIETLTYNFIPTDQTSDSCFGEFYEERILLFAALCNCCKNFSFKSRAQSSQDNHEDFIVGLYTPEGIVTIPVQMAYWNCFQIPAVDGVSIYESSSFEDRLNKLKSLVDKSKEYKKTKL